MNFNKYQNINCTLVKVTDTKFNNEHPRNINTGYTLTGLIDINKSNLFGAIFMGYDNDTMEFHTSSVTRIEECYGYDLIHTLNSVYKLTPIFTAITGAQEKYSLTF